MSFSGTTSSDKATDLGKNNARTYKDDYNDLTFSLDDFKLEQREILDLDSQRTSVTLTASVWQELGALWKCSSNEDMKKMKIKVISYCCVNGSSPYMDGDVEVAGKLRPIKDLLVILGAKQHTLRQFMRANADLAAAIMQANPGLSSTVARKKAIDSTFATFAADFMDCREDLKVGTDAYNEVMRSRTRALKGAVSDFENTREYISQSIPKTQGHNDVKNQRTFF